MTELRRVLVEEAIEADLQLFDVRLSPRVSMHIPFDFEAESMLDLRIVTLRLG